MKAGPVEVGRLLQNRWRFCVPIYQRHYVWTREKQWEPFWTEIRTKAIERLTGRERRFSHFMGAVVLEARGGFSATRVPSFQVVDGQQRLTTFQLFLTAAKQYADSAGLTATAEKISTYLFNDKPHLMVEPAVEIYKVWPTQADRKLFTDILNHDRQFLRTHYAEWFYARQDRIYEYRTVPRLLGAYGYFYERIRHSVETDDLDDEFTEAPELPDDPSADQAIDLPTREIKLDAIWQALVEEFKVVEIVLEEGDDAQVIFETLNERGEPLLAADLVRNNIFQRADASGENADALFSSHWSGFEDAFWSVEEKQGRYRKARIEFFLSNYISGQIASEINLSKLFSEYKAFSRRRNFPSVADELLTLGRYGVIYRELIERATKSDLADFGRRLRPWDVTTIYPLVLRLWDQGSMLASDKRTALDWLVSFVVRRAVCGLTTKNYNKLFLSAVAFLDGEGWSLNGLGRFLLAQSGDSGRFPRDEEFEQQWIQAPLYSRLQPARARALLEALELAKRTAFHETSALASSLTVEHVLPQQWTESWPLPDGTTPSTEQLSAAFWSQSEDESPVGRIVRRQRLKESIGNLTLLTQPLNSSVSNGPFQAKRTALEKHSLLVLNREITSHERWGEAEIQDRGRRLFSLARRIWLYPDVSHAEHGH